MLSFGIDTECLHLWLQNKKLDIFGFIDITEELGAQGIMINLIAKKNQDDGLGALGVDTPSNIQKVADYLETKGMFVELATRGTNPEHLTHIIDVAQKLGAKVIRTFVMSGGGYSDRELSGKFDKAVFEKAADELKKMVPLLEKTGIELGIENHELETTKEVVGLVEEVNSNQVGVHFDVGNTMMAWENPIDGLKIALPYIKSTHIKDHVVIKVDGELYVCGVPCGEGNIDLNKICQELKKTNLEHIIIEMCYPYAAPFRRPLGTGGVTETDGVFRIEKPPFDTDFVKPLDYYTYEGKDLELLMDAQIQGLKTSVNTIKKILGEK